MVKKNNSAGLLLLGIGVIAFAGLGGLSRTRGFIDSFRGSDEEESTDTDPITEEQQGSENAEDNILPDNTSKDTNQGGNPINNFFLPDSSFSNSGFPSAARNQTPFGDPSDPLGAFRGTTFFRDTDQREVTEGFSPFRANVRPPQNVSGGRRTVGVATQAGRNAAISRAARPAVGAVNSSTSRTGSVTQDIIENLRAGRPITTAQRSGRGGNIGQASSIPRPTPSPPTPPTPSTPSPRIDTSVFQPSTGFGGSSRTVTRTTTRPTPEPTAQIRNNRPPPRREEPVDRRLANSTSRSRTGRATQNARFRRV